MDGHLQFSQNLRLEGVTSPAHFPLHAQIPSTVLPSVSIQLLQHANQNLLQDLMDIAVCDINI